MHDTISHFNNITGVCSLGPPTGLSLRSKLLLKLVSLVAKLQQSEELQLGTLQTVVCLLECLQGFPELAGRKKTLKNFLTDAMCQVSKGLGMPLDSHCKGRSIPPAAVIVWPRTCIVESTRSVKMPGSGVCSLNTK